MGKSSPKFTSLSSNTFINLLKGQQDGDSPCYRKYTNDWGYEVISIENVLIDEPVIIKKGKFTKRIELKNCILNKEFRIDGGIFQKWVRIYSGLFNDISIDGGSFLGGMRIAGGYYVKPVRITGGIFDKWLRIFGGVFYKGVNIEGGKFSKAIQIKRINQNTTFFLNSLVINMRLQSRLEIENVNINSLKILNEICGSGFIRIQDVGARNIYINVDNFGQLGFFRVNSTELQEAPTCLPNESIHDFLNNLVQDYSCSTKAALSFVNSQLGDVYFKNFDFSSYSTIIVSNSSLEAIKQFGITFPVKSKNVYTSDTKDRNYLSLRELYNDLQNAAAKNGNKLLQHVYHAEQLDIYRKQLAYQKQYLKAFPLYALKISSDYGQDWLRALTFTIMSTLFFYILYLIFHPNIMFGIDYFTKDNVMYFLRKFVEFMFPTHKTDIIANPSNVSVLFDYSGRICAGFGLYQTISAFRRYALK